MLDILKSRGVGIGVVVSMFAGGVLYFVGKELIAQLEAQAHGIGNEARRGMLGQLSKSL